jgi:hypothetical protein
VPQAYSSKGQGGMASGSTDAIPGDAVVLSVFPGAEGSFRLYEDDGVSEGYREGQYEWTQVRTRMEDQQTWVVEIDPVEGRCLALPAERRWTVILEGSRQPQRVLLDGAGYADWVYNPQTLTTAIHLPLRDKGQGATVTAWSQHRISALGEAHNCAVVRGDVQRLLGDHCPPDPSDVEAVLHTEVPGTADAVARLGGPFVRFIEFTTPEEATQQLGRAIVGGPADAGENAGRGEPYDLEVSYVLFREDRPERHTVRRAGVRTSQILDAPFAFDGQVRTMHWQAEVKVTWKGRTLASTFQSQTLFPTIYAWQGAVYDAEEAAPLPWGVVDEVGRLNEQLDWAPYVQGMEGLTSLTEPHAVLFSREHRQALQEGKPLAGYLVARVISPDDRQAVLWFRAWGSAKFYLNGRPVKESSVKGEERGGFSSLHGARKSVLLQLCAGENTLLVDTRPPQEGRRFWGLGAAFTTPGGEWMTDLRYR